MCISGKFPGAADAEIWGLFKHPEEERLELLQGDGMAGH